MVSLKSIVAIAVLAAAEFAQSSIITRNVASVPATVPSTPAAIPSTPATTNSSLPLCQENTADLWRKVQGEWLVPIASGKSENVAYMLVPESSEDDPTKAEVILRVEKSPVNGNWITTIDVPIENGGRSDDIRLSWLMPNGKYLRRGFALNDGKCRVQYSANYGKDSLKLGVFVVDTGHGYAGN